MKYSTSTVQSYQITLAFSGAFFYTTMSDYESPSCEPQILFTIKKIKESITFPQNSNKSSDSTPINRLTIEKVVTQITKEAQSQANRLEFYGFSDWSQEPKVVTGKLADGSDTAGLLYDIIKVLPNKVCLGTGDKQHDGSSAEMRPTVANDCFTRK